MNVLFHLKSALALENSIKLVLFKMINLSGRNFSNNLANPMGQLQICHLLNLD